MALLKDILEKLRSMMMVARTVADTYGLLMSRLVELFTPSIMEHLNNIILQPELGGRMAIRAHEGHAGYPPSW